MRNAASVNREKWHDRFLARLHELGGKAGNAALREALGWEEATYEAVRTELVSVGRVILGRGRGGSVALPEGLA